MRNSFTWEQVNGSLVPDQPTIDIASHYLFAPLDESQWRWVQSRSKVRHLDARKQLFTQGDPANAFWWVESGQINLYRLSSHGHQKIMGLVEPGRSFAEGILFMDSPRYPVNAEAVVASTVHGFDRDTYLQVLENSFAACRGLFREMVRRTQSHLDEIEALTIQNARFRLVHYLLRLRPSGPDEPAWTIQLPARKALIASQLAMSPETLSRLFRDLEGKDLLRVRGNIIHIGDDRALLRLLE